jgi:hypothetical protein
MPTSIKKFLPLIITGSVFGGLGLFAIIGTVLKIPFIITALTSVMVFIGLSAPLLPFAIGLAVGFLVLGAAIGGLIMLIGDNHRKIGKFFTDVINFVAKLPTLSSLFTLFGIKLSKLWTNVKGCGNQASQQIGEKDEEFFENGSPNSQDISTGSNTDSSVVSSTQSSSSANDSTNNEPPTFPPAVDSRDPRETSLSQNSNDKNLDKKYDGSTGTDPYSQEGEVILPPQGFNQNPSVNVSTTSNNSTSNSTSSSNPAPDFLSTALPSSLAKSLSSDPTNSLTASISTSSTNMVLSSKTIQSSDVSRLGSTYSLPLSDQNSESMANSSSSSSSSSLSDSKTSEHAILASSWLPLSASQSSGSMNSSSASSSSSSNSNSSTTSILAATTGSNSDTIVTTSLTNNISPVSSSATSSSSISDAPAPVQVLPPTTQQIDSIPTTISNSISTSFSHL